MSYIHIILYLRLDPADIETTVQKIKGVVGTGYGDGETRYDCFINYRVASDADIAEKLYLYLKTANVHAFLDRKCLKVIIKMYIFILLFPSCMLMCTFRMEKSGKMVF